MALPLGWVLHCIAIYILPAAIAFGLLVIIAYFLFPRYIFTSIPSIFTTTTTILAFPAQIVTKTPELWCRYVKVGCLMKNIEGEEVMRNATFATDLEVRNAFTVIHNLNSLNNSSNRLVIDSVPPLSRIRSNLPRPLLTCTQGQHPLCRRRSITFIQLDRSRIYSAAILQPCL